jgi:hypothetical protein
LGGEWRMRKNVKEERRAKKRKVKQLRKDYFYKSG